MKTLVRALLWISLPVFLSSVLLSYQSGPLPATAGFQQPSATSLPQAGLTPGDLPHIQGDKIEPELLRELETAGQADFFVWLADKADLEASEYLRSKQEKGEFVFQALQATANRSQAGVRSLLDAQGVRYRPYYIANAILVRDGSRALLLRLAALPEVSRITANHTFQIELPPTNPKGIRAPAGVEANITFTRADQVWALGFTGQGIVLAANDTGLDWTHPAIQPHYRGWNGVTADHNYNWWDATSTYPDVPGDGFGHGTHVSGTMVGDDGGDNQIGMAPGAQTIHCKNMTDDGGGDDAGFLECLEWNLAPWDLNGQNPRPDLAPDAVNNSWGYRFGGYPIFSQAIANLQAAGILVEVSAGNDGQWGCSTLGSPGDYAEVLTTGSVSFAPGALPGALSWFSSRGPSSLTEEYVPDVMAPGEDIRSSLPGGGYESWDGTSMAGPHTVGLVGLVWEANPGLRGMVYETQQLLFGTAVPLAGQTGSGCGGDYILGPNHDWGYGSIDALAAVQAALSFGGVGTLAGQVTDAASSVPLEGVRVRARLNPDLAWEMRTDVDGLYSRVVFSGTYTVTAQLYGYYPALYTGVAVIADETTTLDIPLGPAPSYTVSGQVTDANTGWPLYAEISVEGYPGAPVWTDPTTGQYAIVLAAGTDFVFHVTTWAEGYRSTQRAVPALTGSQVEDFTLEADLAACTAPGYTPEYVYFEDFESDDGGYTMSGYTSWEWGTPVYGAPGARSGERAWATNLEGHYNFQEDGALTSPVIDLSPYAGRHIIVTWWQVLKTQSYFDTAWGEASNDGGATWTQIYGPVDGPVDLSWTRQRVVLDPSYAVAGFRLRFILRSDELANHIGFYLDDVGVGVELTPETLYTEDFEAGDGGFTTSGVSSWERGTPTRGPGAAHSGVNVWATNLAGDYADGEDGYVTSPEIDLSAAAGNPLLLSWWGWLQTESGYDFASVEVSDGLDWTEVYTASGIIDQAWTQRAVVLDPAYAVSAFQVRFRLRADDSVTYQGFYVDDLRVEVYSDTSPGQLCHPPVGGLVVGHVFDANTLAPLNGAALHSAAAAARSGATPGDDNLADGFYTLFAPAGQQTITATLGGGYGQDARQVEVLPDEAAVLGLYLLAGRLAADPPALQAVLGMSTSVTLTLNLENAGELPMAFTGRAIAAGFSPILRSPAQPASGRQGKPEGLNELHGATNERVTAPGDRVCVFKDSDPTWLVETEDDLLASGIPFGVYPSASFASLDFDACKMIVISSAQPQSFYDAYAQHLDKFESYVRAGGFLQVFAAYDTWGESGILGAPLPGGMTFEIWSNDGVYIDDPAHPVVQGVPAFLYGFPLSLGIFDNLPEEAYVIAHEWVNDQPVMVEYPLGEGWLIAHSIPLELWRSTQIWDVGIILDNTLSYGYGYSPEGPGWLSATPLDGAIDPGESQALAVRLDAGALEVDQPGAYAGQVLVIDDSPYGATFVDVTMNVDPPAGWGKLAGTITGLGVCDAPGEPLAKAQVEIAGVASLKSGSDGGYGYWMPAGEYTLNVSAPTYAPYSASVTISPGQVSTYNLDLRLEAPCTAVSTTDLTLSLPAGSILTRTLALTNTGAGILDYTAFESALPLAVVPNLPVDPVSGPLYPVGQSLAPETDSQTIAAAGITAPHSGWFGAADMPIGLDSYGFAQCAEQPGSFYVFSGREYGGQYSPRNWRYDASENDWTELAPLPFGLDVPAAACYQGKIYLMGGSGSDLFFVYDINADTWGMADPLPRSVGGAAAAAWDGKLYLVGGDAISAPPAGLSGRVDVYDIATGSWSLGAPMPIPASHAGYAQIGPYLYLAGGWGELSPEQNVKATQRYDLSGDAWEVGPAFPSGRANFALTATESALFAIAGDEDGGFFFDDTDQVEIYALEDWPAGAWAASDDPYPAATSANRGGACTQALMDPASAEVWSWGGAFSEPYGSSIAPLARVFFQERTGERCYSIYSEVPWLAISPAEGEIPGDSAGALSLRLDATWLEEGIYTATLTVASNDLLSPVFHLPVTVLVDPHRLYLPLIGH